MPTQSVEEHLEKREWPVAAQRVKQPKESKVGFRSRVGDALWRASSGFSFAGLFLSFDPAFREPSSSFSPIEKARREADLRGL
jgi:hypothetical protein